MEKLFEKFKKLNIDLTLIGLAEEEDHHYFCTPLDSKIIGWDNGIHYCFIKQYGEIVFAVNPDTCCDYYVYPIAKNFSFFRFDAYNKSNEYITTNYFVR